MSWSINPTCPVPPLQTSAQLLVEPVLHPFLRPQQLPNVVAAPIPRGETRSTRFHTTTTWFWGVDLSASAFKKYNRLNIAWEYRPTFLYRPNPKFIPSVAKCLAFSRVSFDSMSLASASVAWKDTKGSLHHKYEQNRCRSTLQKALQLVKNHFEVGSATNCYFSLLYMQKCKLFEKYCVQLESPQWKCLVEVNGQRAPEICLCLQDNTEKCIWNVWLGFLCFVSLRPRGLCPILKLCMCTGSYLVGLSRTRQKSSCSTGKGLQGQLSSLPSQSLTSQPEPQHSHWSMHQGVGAWESRTKWSNDFKQLVPTAMLQLDGSIGTGLVSTTHLPLQWWEEALSQTARFDITIWQP